MATTVTNGTLKVTITEQCYLNGKNQGGSQTFSIDDVDEIFQRIITCAASQTTIIAEFRNDTYEASGAIDIEDSKYIRITNLDNTNSVELAIITVSTNYQVKLDAGQSHVLGSANDLMLAEADTNPAFSTMGDVNSIKVNPGSNAVDVEVFVASV